MDIRANLYNNNFIAFAFSFCNKEICNDENNEHYSGFMIFSYPSGKDIDLNVTDYLLKNNDIKIDNITINLIENVFIENNIFGYEYSQVQITDISGCNNINLLSRVPRSQLPPSAKAEFYKRIRIKKTVDCSVGTLGTEKQWKVDFNFEEYFQCRIGIQEY